jgi:protein involved in polysaccharide export with SLBB domain
MARYRHASLIAAVVIGIGLSAGCSSSPPHDIPAPSAAAGEPPAVAGSEQIVNSVEGYRLGPGDRIRLTVFRHEDLSGEFELDGEGFFAMPLVGEIAAHDVTARQLEGEVESQLSEQGYLVGPQVSVEVLNYRPFYIIGEVNQPGSYPYVNGMNVVNAVALAGGFTYRAGQDDIVISRGGSNGTSVDAGLTTQVLPGDIIEIPERFF